MKIAGAGGGAPHARLAGKAAARARYPVTDNATADRQNLKAIGFLGAEQVRQTRMANEAARTGWINKYEPQARSVPKGYDTSAQGALKRLIQHAPELGLNPESLQFRGLTGHETRSLLHGGGMTAYKITDPLSHYTGSGRGDVTGAFATGSPVYTPEAYIAAGAYNLLRHPIATAQGVGHILKRDVTNPGAGTALDAFALASLLRGGAARVGAARAAATDATATEGRYLPTNTPTPAGAAMKALLKRPVGGMRTLTLNEGGGQISKTQALNSENPFGRDLAKLTDRALGLQQGVQRRGLIGGVVNKLAKAKFNVEKAQNERTMGDIYQADHPEMRLNLSRENPVVRSMDAINRVSRAGILYGKPGYLFTNLPGQEGLAATEQGLLSPVNRYRASQYGGKLGQVSGQRWEAKDLRRLRAAAGSGIQASLEPGTGLGSLLETRARQLDQGIGNAYGSILDTPYRTASIIHQLRRQGITDPAAMKKALADAVAHENVGRGELTGYTKQAMQAKFTPNQLKVLEASRRANRSMIDYGRLGKLSKAARHAIFFVPWLKGSSLYTGQYALEHPAQMASLFALGRYGRTHTGLPTPVPGFMQGDFSVGKDKQGRPLIVNPTSAGIIQQPFQLADNLGALAGLEPTNTGNDPNSLLTPFFGAAQAATTHYDSFTGKKYPGNESSASIFYHQLRDQLPLVQLKNRLENPPANNPNTLFPYTRNQAAGAWAFGGFGPRPDNTKVQISRGRAEEVNSASSPQDVARLRAHFTYQDLVAAIRAHGGHPAPQLAQLAQTVSDYNVAQATVHQQIGGKVDSAVKLLTLLQYAYHGKVPPDIQKRIVAARATPRGRAILLRSLKNVKASVPVTREVTSWNRAKKQLGVSGG